MGELFNGWRRKFGLLLLVLAIVLTGVWMRSLGIEDTFRISIGCAVQYIESRQGGVGGHVEVYSEKPPPSESAFEWESYAIDPPPPPPPPGTLTLIVGGGQVNAEESLQLSLVPIPYWFIVIVLTILSARALLTKPRMTNRENVKGVVQSSAICKGFTGVTRVFYEWRPRVGLVTSLLAVAMLGLWGSGNAILIGYCTGEHRVDWFGTSDKGFVWKWIDVPEDSGQIPNAVAMRSDIFYTEPFDCFEDFEEENRIQSCGVQFVTGVDQRHELPSQVWIIPYWPLVAWLTLVSLWLLFFSKPRKSIQNKTTESVRVVGA